MMKDLNISPSGCLEKKDLVNKILKFQEQEKKKVQSGKPYIEKKNGMKCIMMQTDENPEMLVFVFHGFGANADNLADVGKYILQQGKVKSKKLKFVTVNAPMELGPDSFAWWPLNLMELAMKRMQQGPTDMFDEAPPKQMEDTRDQVRELIYAEMKKYKLPMSKVVLAGFSQGSWLATELALTMKEQAAALVVYSGALYKKEWIQLASEKKGLKVLQFHGQQDFILPFEQGQLLHDALKKGGLDTNFHSFFGEHTIPEIGLQKLDDMLHSLWK
eukprot:CAMPEP_0167752342 /NCGR_PEP_ID=MMETSP0110_2-20121227/7085_1 /TAXON_ID=629695 /ORGANISM="Gymnochlora sp., Strain CCMP2014" /LENGTH=272 /DNA_ID=CAMNT_0007637947 /DNA_START=179 /DNA_END=997 /DNA_ORIENTATION=-